MTVGRAAILPLVVAVLALGACGEDRDEGAKTGTTGTTPTTGTTAEGTAGATGKPVATVKVSETEFKLDPENPRVAKSGVIAFEVSNDGQTVHALEVEGPSGEVESSTLDPGERTVIKADLPPGTYKWYCPVGDHEQRGMVGRVRVAE